MKILAVILTTTAVLFAQDAVPQSGSGMTSLLPMMVLFFIVIYFFMIRPEQKKQKELDKMRAALKKGDEVVTMGGICGTVFKVLDNNKVVIKIDEKAMMTVLAPSISNVNPTTDGKADTKPETTDKADK
jgi:preprotein translocase subunit YajC